MNCGNPNINLANINTIPWGTGESKPDKPVKKVRRWSKTFLLYEEGTVDEAGTSNRLRWRGCQLYAFAKSYHPKEYRFILTFY